jgi:hypothetical protein
MAQSAGRGKLPFSSFVSQSALIGQLQRLGAKPLHTDNSDKTIWQDATHGGVGLEIFEGAHAPIIRDVLT